MTRHTLRHLVLLLAVVAAGCATSSSPGTSASAIRATTSPSGQRLVTVPVELDDYVIRMPASIPAGAVTFEVKNVGHHAHRLKIRGGEGDEEVDADMDANLAPGESGTLAATLPPGTYRVTCPVGPHTMLGMKRTVKVTE